MPSVIKLENGIKVFYVTKEQQLVITPAEHDMIEFLRDHKVRAIKFIRDQYNLGLYESKQIVDTIHQNAVQL